MSRRTVKLALLALFVLSFFSGLSSSAYARRGVILITSGNTIKHLAEISPEMKPVVRSVTGTSTDYHVGYLHERIGVFWIDLWTWDGEYILYDDSEEEIWSLDAEQTASIIGTTPDELSKPFFYTFPPGLLVVGTIGAVFLGLETQARKSHAQTSKEVDRLLADPRYEHALEPILKNDFQRRVAEAPGSSGGESYEEHSAVFDRSVRQLVEQGIDYNEAYCNLSMLVDAARSYQA